MRRRYFRYGVAGLISKHGQHLVGSCVPDDYFEYFKTLYLIEGGPSLRSCRDLTLGYAVRELGADRNNFPSFMAFKRRLDKEIPEQSIYLARNGQAAWNRKYNNFIDRDYSAITCNQVWVSDHAQIDVACYDENNKVVFPWVTVWRDYKSGKWLGWILQTGNPNSDLIFQSFYYAVEEFGLPKDVIIDNGKDYRSRDFAGGRKPCVNGGRRALSKTLSPQQIDGDVRVSEGNSTGAKGRKNFKIETNKNKTSAMLKELNVNVHFALPYNAQTKPVERDFLKIKELLSKHFVGYRGGNVVERPEKLAKEIKDGKIMKFEDFKEIFDKTIINILNKKPSNGKNLNGRCPDDLFYEEYKEKIVTSKDALKLFCSRTSKDYTIGRNGIKDGKFQTTYWADWMIHKKGMKVYMRRDIKNYKEAWVFNTENDEFLGKAEAVKSAAALYAPEVSKEEFEAAVATKKRNIKIAKAYIKQNKEISAMEKYQNYETAYQSVEREYKKPVKVSKIANTSMDKALQKNKDMESFGKADLSIFLPEEERKFYHWETEKYLDEPDDEEEEIYFRQKISNQVENFYYCKLSFYLLQNFSSDFSSKFIKFSSKFRFLKIKLRKNIKLPKNIKPT